MEHNYYYCERNSLSFLAEPLNLFTNLSFILFSILLLKDKKISNKILPLILFGIGLGSMLLHSIPNIITAIVDVFFIILFIFYFLLILYNKLNVNFYLSLGCSAIFIIFCYLFGLNFKDTILKDSAFYFPILMHLYFLVFYFYLIKNKRRLLKSFFLIPVLFTLSLFLRTVDFKYCTIFPLGTHFFWHLLNSVVLYLSIKFIYLIPNRSPPKEPS